MGGKISRTGRAGFWRFVTKYFNLLVDPGRGILCAYYWGAIGSDSDRVPSPLFPMKTLSILSICAAPFVILLIGSLAAEDQRAFLACRANGASADYCRLIIGGR